MLTLIVDGNNVVAALGFRRPDAVEQFLTRIELAAVEKDWEAAVVFDGPERYLRRESGPLVVRYMQGKTADSLIERMVYQESDRSRVIVVTQDRAESQLVRGFGAMVWSPQRFLEELNRVE